MANPKTQKGIGIQNWLYLLLILVLLPLLVLQGYRYYKDYQEKQEEALQANLEIARAVAKSFESFVHDVLRQELAIGLAITSSQKMTPGDINRLLVTSSDYPAVRDFTWLNPEGIAIYSNNPALIGTNFSDRSYVRDVVSGRDWAVGELVIGKLFGKPIFGISRGIRDDSGNLLGVIFGAVLPDKLDAQLAIERSKGGAITLVDRQGMLVYRYPAIETSWEERNWLKQYPEYEEVFKGKEISRTFFATYEGKDRLASIVPISSIGWAAGAGKRKEDVTGPIFSSLVRDAVLFLSVSLLAFLITAALSRTITNPIGSLRNYASSLGDGEMPNKVDVGDVLELRDLAESFDTMAEKVRSREMALRQTEERLRTAQKYGEVGVWSWDVRAGHLVLEPELEELYGLPPGTIRSYQDWASAIHPEDLARIENERDTALDQHKPFRLEFRVRRASGGERWMLASGRGEYDNSGQLSRVFGVNVDITESKRLEEVLKRRQAEIQALFDNTPAGLVLFDAARPYTVLVHNRYYQELFAEPYRSQGMVGLNVYDYAPEVDAAGVSAVFDEVVRTKQAKSFLDFPYNSNPSTESWFNWHMSPIMLDDRAVALVSMSIDVTDYHRAREALQKAKDELEERVKERTYELYAESLYARSLIEASLDPLLTISIDGKIMDVNHASEEITGLTKEQLIGSDFSDYFTEPEKARAGYEEVFRHGFVRDYPLELRRRDGHVTPVLYNASVYRDETGEIMGVFAAARDITERKQAETALRKLASELVIAEERERKRIAGVLHDEVAQTLAAAKMRIDMLQLIPFDQEDKQTLKDARSLLLQSIQETRALMTDIGNPLLSDLGLQAACESLANRLMERHPVRISCDIQDTYKHLNPDVKTILYQMFRELLNNVVKHSKAQNANVMIDMENGHFRLKVTDDGVGFDPQTLGAPTVEGGFGLYSIRERLIAINGSLKIESTAGGGTVVTVFLPVALD